MHLYSEYSFVIIGKKHIWGYTVEVKCGDTGTERAASDGDGDPAGRRGRACVYEEF